MVAKSDGNQEWQEAWQEWLHGVSADECLLRRLSDATKRQLEALGDISRKDVLRCLQAGLTLRWGWPRPWNTCAKRLLGPRLYLMHSAVLTPGSLLASLASSALGRGRQQLAQWPTLLDAALNRIRLHEQLLLMVPGTTVYQDALSFAQRAGLQYLNVQFDKPIDGTTIGAWLSRVLSMPVEQLRDRLCVSPAFDVATSTTGETDEEQHDRELAAQGMLQLPLQDRLALSLSDVVLALHVRPGGTIDRLLHERLTAPEYPVGATYCAVKPLDVRSSTGNLPHWAAQLPLELMDRGAVGWYVLPRTTRTQAGVVLACHQSRPPVVQWTARSELLRSLEAGSTGNNPWLAHCTRSTVGPDPGESEEQFRDRLWLTGMQAAKSALHVLGTIMARRQLKASAHLYRGGNACVSFTSVRLAELLRRRTFRPHLGRWDWEPYGLLVRRQTLEQLGCRPVIYGTETDYQLLPAHDRPFFQPATSASGGSGWTLEREWRLEGDLDLSQLPTGSWLAFTRTQCEAHQLARCNPCPVVWTSER